MRPISCNARSAIACTRANARVAELLAQKRTAVDRGRGEWSADDEAELAALRHDLDVAMCAVAAEMILPHLDAYRRPPCPERPPRVERPVGVDKNGVEVPPKTEPYRTLTGDAAVEHTIGGIMKKERRSLTEQRVLKLWTSHVAAVQKAEAEGASRVLALLRYLRHADAAGDTETAEALRGFLGREWGHGGAIDDDLDAQARRLARRRDVISDRLMYGGKPTSERRGGKARQICASEVM